MENIKETNEPEFIELDEINVIIKIPQDSARIDLTAHILDDDGHVVKVCKTLRSEDIREARRDFLDNVEEGDDYDARYIITDEGRAWLEKMENLKNDEVHCVCD